MHIVRAFDAVQGLIGTETESSGIFFGFGLEFGGFRSKRWRCFSASAACCWLGGACSNIARLRILCLAASSASTNSAIAPSACRACIPSSLAPASGIAGSNTTEAVASIGVQSN